MVILLCLQEPLVILLCLQPCEGHESPAMSHWSGPLTCWAQQHHSKGEAENTEDYLMNKKHQLHSLITHGTILIAEDTYRSDLSQGLRNSRMLLFLSLSLAYQGVLAALGRCTTPLQCLRHPAPVEKPKKFIPVSC